MNIHFLGTSSAQPSLTRNTSSLCFDVSPKASWLFDCGEGTQHQILKKKQVKLSKITKIFITHLHLDHCLGLPGLLCTLIGGRSRDLVEKKKFKPIEIYGPKGIRLFVRTSLRISNSMLHEDCLTVHELVQPNEEGSCSADTLLPDLEIQGEDIYPDEDGVWTLPIDDKEIESVKAVNLDHTIDCVGFVIKEITEDVGKILPKLILPHLERNSDALKEQGIKNPKSLIGKIKKGETIELPDGHILSPSTCSEPATPGRVVIILGDTSNSDKIFDIVEGPVDCIVHEATNAYIAEDEKEDTTEEMINETTKEHGHSTPTMAAEFAKKLNCRLLLLNHFSSRYSGDIEDEQAVQKMEQIKNQATNVLGHDNVVTAYDLLTVEIPKPTIK